MHVRVERLKLRIMIKCTMYEIIVLAASNRSVCEYIENGIVLRVFISIYLVGMPVTEIKMFDW